jgi:hypothetical protein
LRPVSHDKSEQRHTNHVNYSNPNTSFGSSTFGEINAGISGRGRAMRFSARFLVYTATHFC